MKKIFHLWLINSWGREQESPTAWVLSFFLKTNKKHTKNNNNNKKKTYKHTHTHKHAHTCSFCYPCSSPGAWWWYGARFSSSWTLLGWIHLAPSAPPCWKLEDTHHSGLIQWTSSNSSLRLSRRPSCIIPWSCFWGFSGSRSSRNTLLVSASWTYRAGGWGYFSPNLPIKQPRHLDSYFTFRETRFFVSLPETDIETDAALKMKLDPAGSQLKPR